MLTGTPGPLPSRAAHLFVTDCLTLKPEESLLVTADSATDPGAVQAIMNAATAVGAKPSVMVIPQLPFQGGLADPFIPEPVKSAACNCDVWVDMTFPYLAGSHVHDLAIEGGRVRFLMLADTTAHGLDRLYGQTDQDLLYEVQRSFDEVAAAALGRPCRITTPAGTDLSFVMGKPGYIKARRADKPGQLTPPGSAAFFPELESVKGQAVITSAFHEYYAPFITPLTITVDGQVREVSGGGNLRGAMDRSLKRAGGGEYGYVIHLTHGFHPAVRSGLGLMEDIRTPGNDAIGLGRPWWEPGGGETHPDGIANMQSIWLDGDLVVEDGQFVNPPELAKLGADLQSAFN